MRKFHEDQMVTLMLTPGELVTIETPAQQRCNAVRDLSDDRIPGRINRTCSKCGKSTPSFTERGGLYEFWCTRCDRRWKETA